MRIFKMWWYDETHSRKQTNVMFVILFFFTFCSCILFYLEKENYYHILQVDTPHGTWLDYVCYTIAGTIKYVPDHISRFEIPDRWIIFHLILLYGTLQYPYRDLTDAMGSNILLKIHSRSYWWIGKSFWCISYITKCYIIFLTSIYVFCCLMGEPIEWKISQELLNDICGLECIEHPLLFLVLFALPFLYSVVMSLLQMVLTLWFKPIYSFLFLVSSMLISSYISSSFFIWNYTMPFRVEGIAYDGFSLKNGLIIGIVAVYFLVRIGIVCFRRYDIYGSE